MSSCDKFTEDFLMMDKGQHFSAGQVIHLMCCRECRTMVRLLSRAEKISSVPLIKIEKNQMTARSIINHIMNSFDSIKPVKVTILPWTVLGIIMILSLFVLIPVSAHFSSSFIKGYLSIFIAVVITIYCILFVGFNIDFFVKKISTRQTA